MSVIPYNEQNRIGIRVEKSEYNIPPGGKTVVSVTLRNQTLEDDGYVISMEGI